MSDARLRSLEQELVAAPTLLRLISYARAAERAGRPLSPDEIAAFLRTIEPFTINDWPFYVSYIDYPSPYFYDKHEDVLQLLARVRPLDSLLEWVERLDDPRDLSAAMSAIRRVILDSAPYDDEYYDDQPERIDAPDLPEFIDLARRSKFDQLVATVVWDRVGPLPGGHASRFGIGFDGEPGPVGIYWERTWDPRRGWGDGNRQFLPYLDDRDE